MAEAKKRLLTYAGLKAIEDELENLKVVKRKEVAGKIKEAREQGDLSENAEYDAAKDVYKRQEFVDFSNVTMEEAADTMQKWTTVPFPFEDSLMTTITMIRT